MVALLNIGSVTKMEWMELASKGAGAVDGGDDFRKMLL